MGRVGVKPELIIWARERAGVARSDLVDKFPKLLEWETGDVQPTLKQLENFARAVHLPIGYLFFDEPPEEFIPIPDYRTIAGQTVARPSPNLLDTIYACQELQDWYRDFARSTMEPKLSFVGSVTMETQPEIVAARISETIGFDVAARRKCSSWTDALRLFIRSADEAGVLVMVNGVVNSNTHRRLDPAEFRGFALSDPWAPLVFVNGTDTKAAQMFTLAHELAHLWLGEPALSDYDPASKPSLRQEEKWCNAVAAELLVPLTELKANLQLNEELSESLTRLSRLFKVSTLVILRRLLDAGWLDRDRFNTVWYQELAKASALAKSGGGGNFYRTTLTRVGHRFALALISSTLEGHTLYRDAFRMLGVSKTKTFNTLCQEFGIL